jgi:hypothetical protein
MVFAHRSGWNTEALQDNGFRNSYARYMFCAQL